MANHCVLRTAVESPLPGLTSSPLSQTQAFGSIVSFVSAVLPLVCGTI